ncbi:MAG: AAA family ATPase [Solirubrobacteraceae bacterium]|nr:AAA family ATPase [Solirubrobacteraceae bacterium]
MSALTKTPRAAALVERELELGAIRRAMAGAADGTGQTIVLDAPAGLGKTALLDAAEGLLGDADWLVRRAAHGPRERFFEYGIVRTLFEAPMRRLDEAGRDRVTDGLAGPAARLLLEGEVTDDDPATEIGHSVVWLCEELARERPLALLVDDAHWADSQSLAVLAYVARRIADLPVLLVVATRSVVIDWDSDVVGILGGIGGATVLQPAAMSHDGAATLIRREAPGASDEQCASCERSTEGNPWLLIELARQLAASGPAVLDDPVRHAVPLSPDARVHLRRRLTDQSPADRAVAEALAILGPFSDHHTVAEIVGPMAGDLTVSRGRLAADGLCRGDAWRLVHPLLEAAVRDQLGPFERERLHRDAARVLQDEGAPAEVVAEHLLACGPARDADASAALQEAAARAAERGDLQAATALAARALDERAPGDDRALILTDLGTTTFHAGQSRAGERLRQALAATEDDATRVEILQRLGALQAIDPTGAWLPDVLEAGEQVEGDPDLALAAELAAMDALLTHTEQHAERAARVQAIDPFSTKVPELRASALAHRAWLGAETGLLHASSCADLARAALSGDVLLDLADVRAGFHLCIRVLMVTDQVEDAEGAITALREKATASGSVVLIATAAWYAGDLALCVGRLADAAREARQALALSPAPGLLSGAATEVLVGALAEQGAFDEAHQILAARPELWTGAEGWETGVRHARAQLLLAEGDFAQAESAAREAGERRIAQGRGNPAWTPWRATLAHALAHQGKFDEAVAVADENVALADAFGAPTACMRAGLARTVCERPGEQRAARAGVALELEAPGVLERAQLQIELGSTLVRLGRRVEAREWLRPAFAVADAAGAAPLAERARRELVASGLRPRKAALDGVAALTPRQTQVCGLAASGRSNREIAQELFLSVKTVETHLAAAYEKLGAPGRAELCAMLADAP